MFDIFYKSLHTILNHYVPNYKPKKSSNNYSKHIFKLKQKVLKLLKTRYNSNNKYLVWTSLKQLLCTQIKGMSHDARFYMYRDSK